MKLAYLDFAAKSSFAEFHINFRSRPCLFNSLRSVLDLMSYDICLFLLNLLFYFEIVIIILDIDITKYCN